MLCLPHLSSDALVAADSDLDGCPPICHGGADDAEMLLAHGHPGIEQVLAVQVQRRADELRDSDARGPVSICTWSKNRRTCLRQNAAVEVDGKQKHTQSLLPGPMLHVTAWVPCWPRR